MGASSCDHAALQRPNIAADVLAKVAKDPDRDAVHKVKARGKCPGCGQDVEVERELLVSYARYALEAHGIDWRTA